MMSCGTQRGAKYTDGAYSFATHGGGRGRDLQHPWPAGGQAAEPGRAHAYVILARHWPHTISCHLAR